MRDIGVFTSVKVSSEELIQFVRAYSLRAGQPCETRPTESVVGDPAILYVFDGTSVTNGYFTEEEMTPIEDSLSSAPRSYISIHFTSVDDAFRLADSMAHEIARIWNGIIDYSGAGGELGAPPVTQ